MNKITIHELYVVKELNREGNSVSQVAKTLGLQEISVYKILERAERKMGAELYTRGGNSAANILSEESKELIRSICYDLDWGVLEELLFKGDIVL